MLHRLKLTKGRLTSDDDKTLEAFRKKFEHTAEYREVKYRKQLLDYDIETDQGKRAQLLKTIGYSTLGLSRLSTKPAYLSEVGRAESSEEESKQDLSKSTVDCKSFFTAAALITQQYGDHPPQMIPGLEHSLDFTKVKPNHFRNFLNQHTDRLANMANATFWTALKTHLDKEFKQNTYF